MNSHVNQGKNEGFIPSRRGTDFECRILVQTAEF